MGKYILIEFDSDEAAERLCAQVNAASAKGKPFRLAGIFQRPPRKRCECGTRIGEFRRGNRKDLVVKRHKRTGLYYCTVCKRVRKGWLSPRNLIDDPDLPQNWFSKGLQREASIHLNADGTGLMKNYPITTRTTPHGETLEEYEASRRPAKKR